MSSIIIKSPPIRRAVYIQHTFPLITFCKPCSVPVYYKRHGCVSYLGGNHLSTGSNLNLSFSSFNSSEKVPLPLFGFLARGVYPFHPFHFWKGYVTVALL